MAQAAFDSGGGGSSSGGDMSAGDALQYAQFAQSLMGKKQAPTAMERRMSRPQKTPMEAIEEVKAR